MKENLVFVWLGDLSKPRSGLGARPALGTWHRTTTDLINCLNRHAALVLHEFLLEGEIVVRYGQTIRELMILGREHQPQLHKTKTAIIEIKAVKLCRKQNLKDLLSE